MKKIIIALLISSAVLSVGYAQSSNLWKGKKCAVVLTYDDAINQQLDNAVPVLDSLGLKATFYVTAFSQSVQTRLSEWKKLAQKGHELGNHTLYHPCVGGTGREWVGKEYDLKNYTVKRMTDEIRMTNLFLQSLDGKTKRTFAFTCGDMKIGDSLFIDGLKNDFVAARAVRNEMHQLNEVNLYNVDCYLVNGHTAEEMEEWVKKAQATNSLLVILFHGVGGGNNLNVAVSEHRAFLKYLKQNEKDIWIAPMIDVAQYVKDNKTFQPTLASFKEQYKFPEWFRDAKFGIWAHWGPQAVPRRGDWYARKLYSSDTYDKKTKSFTGKPDVDYADHLSRYGHPSQFGFKDIIPLWKAERFNPEALMKLYKRVGAKYFVSMGSHHDNFFLWNSKIHRWNAANMGPKKDIVGLWQAAAKKQGLRFGVSEHLAASYTWFQTSRGADKTGPYAGIPYDGTNPLYEDLYHKKTDSLDNGWLTTNHENQVEWLNSITELIDNYHPDLLYSDSELPFDSIGRKMLAHYYNENKKFNNGKLEAVYNAKHGSTNPMWVLDIEKGLTDSITTYPWQTDTSIGDWFYREGQKYQTANDIVLMLIDIVSKNGNLLLNIVQTPEGDLEQDVQHILEEVATWTAINGEGIYGTRPWKVYGEGPSVTDKKEAGTFGGIKDFRTKPYTAADFRFTQKGKTIYAFCMTQPTTDLLITSLASGSKLLESKIASVEILGSKMKLQWHQTAEGLFIKRPTDLPKGCSITVKINIES